MISTRQESLFQAVEDSGYAGLALNPGPTLAYSTGLHYGLMERPIVALFVPGKPVTIILPELEVSRTEVAPFEKKLFPYGESLEEWDDAFGKACRFAALDAKRIGVEPRSMRFLELAFLQKATTHTVFESAEHLIDKLRISKDEEELALIRKAVGIAEAGLSATLPSIRTGVTEREIAATLVANLLSAGADPELPFNPIVAVGPNSADPHAIPGDLQVAKGDVVLVDWGANYRGYAADLTRMFAVGEPSEKVREIVAIVGEANAAGRKQAGPGVLASDVDKATRATIEKAGYGDRFIHRTGHGFGLEIHEAPYIRGDNHVELASGMTFTIEPGIYLTGLAGARIEDDVVITGGGSESLSTMPRELRILPS
ncbi:MAG: aminopeptidase P family protein [Bacteroidetes bacterium]|nr:aminopeptidase P family protein [Bacteroidota bacterium]